MKFFTGMTQNKASIDDNTLPIISHIIQNNAHRLQYDDNTIPLKSTIIQNIKHRLLTIASSQ